MILPDVNAVDYMFSPEPVLNDNMISIQDDAFFEGVFIIDEKHVLKINEDVTLTMKSGDVILHNFGIIEN